MTVLVPTYRRCKDLERCLTGLKRQTRPADELLLVIRDTDSETWNFIQNFPIAPLPLRLLSITEPGVVAALNLGLEQVTGEIVVMTDDDACPHADWLARIETHFLTNLQVGGVGGRDWIYHGTMLQDGSCDVVGQLQWFGRLIGNHHLGVGPARPVDVLKGVNMSYRTAAVGQLRFDRRLRGKGAQVHNELGFCLPLRRAGWSLIYDPQIGVDHYPSQRFGIDQRNQFNSIATSDAVCNKTLLLLEHFSPWQHLILIPWSLLIGTRQSPGVVQWLRFLPSQGKLSTQKFLACLRGRWQGWQLWRQQQHDRPRMPAPAPQMRTSS